MAWKKLTVEEWADPTVRKMALNLMMTACVSVLPEKFLVTVVVFGLPGAPTGTGSYVSNAERKSCAEGLREVSKAIRRKADWAHTAGAVAHEDQVGAAHRDAMKDWERVLAIASELGACFEAGTNLGTRNSLFAELGTIAKRRLGRD